MRTPAKIMLVTLIAISSMSGCASNTPAPMASPSSVATVQAPASGPQTVAYADTSSTQTMDVYLPTGATGPTPVVVLIHGGAFQMGDSSMEAGYAQTLVDNGFAVAAVSYRLSGEAAYPAGAQDVNAAVRYLRAPAAQYNINPDEVAAWGQSAGGYLVNLLEATGDQNTIFDVPLWVTPTSHRQCRLWCPGSGPATSPPWTSRLPTWPRAQVVRSRMALPKSPESQCLGEAVATSDKTASTDLTAYVAKASTLPAWYLAHGDSGCLVPSGQSTELKAALDGAGADSQLVVLKGAGHADPTRSTPRNCNRPSTS